MVHSATYVIMHSVPTKSWLAIQLWQLEFVHISCLSLKLLLDINYYDRALMQTYSIRSNCQPNIEVYSTVSRNINKYIGLE